MQELERQRRWRHLQENRLNRCGHVLRGEEEFIRRLESDGYADVGGKEGGDDQSGGGWITSRTTYRIDCQGRTPKIECNGGVS